MPHGIVLLGANGSGKSTLGRELARLLNFAHLDAEEYYFYKTDIPYTSERPHHERNELMLADMKKYGSFVVSGDISGWSDDFLPLFDLAVFLKAPKDMRMKNIDVAELEQRADKYPCPVIETDSMEDYRTVAFNIAERFYTKPGEPWRVITYPLGELKKYRFTIICAQYKKVGGGWLYARHKNRDTWETAGGHIEKGETPLDCAKRELRE